MDKNIEQVLKEVFESVLEQFAFAFCEWVPKEELQPGGNQFIHAALAFSGPQSGGIFVIVPAQLGVSLASNILGIDPEDENALDYSQDSMKEFLNVLIGNVLTALYGEDTAFDIGTPVAFFLNESEWTSFISDSLTLGVLVEDQPTLLRFALDEE